MKIINTLIVKGFLITLLLTSNFIFAQDFLEPTNEKTYTEYIDKILEPLIQIDASIFKNGILYDRVYPIARLDVFNQTDSTNTSNTDHFKRAWSELYSASLSPDFLTLQNVKDIAYHFERQNIIQVGIINTDFTQIDSIALKQGNAKLQVVNQRVERIANNNPYIDKQVVVIAPLNSGIVYGNTITFEFGKILLMKSEKQIKELTV